MDNKQVLPLTKDMLEDLCIIAVVYNTTVEQIIRDFTQSDYNIEYIA